MKTRIVAIITLATIMATLTSGCRIGTPVENNANHHPILAVLCSKESKAIYCIEVDSLKITNKIKLRSLSLDFTAGDDGIIYTSQTGGVGSNADNVIGVVNVRAGRVERYFKLKNRNPGEITYVNGKIVVINGIMLKNGNLIGEIIEPKNGYKSTSIEVLGITGGDLAPFKDKLYTSALTDKSASSSDAPDEKHEQALISIDLNTKRSSRVLTNTYFNSIVFDDRGMGYGLISRSTGHGFQESPIDKVVVFNPVGKSIVKTIDLEKQSMSANSMVWYDDKLYITYFSGEDLSRTGDSISIVDPSTGTMDIIKGFKGPHLVLPVKDKIFVANYDNGTVDVLDIKSRERLSSIKVGGWPEDLALVDASTR
ncbi:MAG: hypothetical protein QME41_01185 [Actinomycetota bacterium]|nr:hypothetical protein [Actinomycetota bacterium]